MADRRRGGRTPLVSLSGDAYALAGTQQAVGRFREVFEPDGGIFSPGYPLVPPDRRRLRTWDFPVGVNYISTPRAYEATGFDELRTLAECHDLTRLAIETRKDQLERLDWSIKPRRGNDDGADTAARIERLARFWSKPDGEQPFATWLREALEDLLVLDAPTFEVRRNRGGQIIALDVVDGATIKLLVDDDGRRPVPPAPAYEQVIHGRPWRLLTSEELIYLPRNRRPHKSYGYSPVEQIVVTVNIGLRRQAMQLQHFTEANIPAGLMNAPDGWNAEQIRQFQEWFDSILAGNTAERTKLVWGPAGAKYQPFREPPYKDEFDEWLARVVCYAFSLPPNAFTRQINRATAETVQDAALAEGLAPLMSWVKRLIDGVIQDRMGHPDLEFAWAANQPLAAEVQATMLAGLVKEGIITRNEARRERGMGPEAGGDRLMVDTPQGPVGLASIAAPPASSEI